MSITVAFIFLSLVQLVWLIVVWRKSGFLSAFTLFAYGTLSAFVLMLSFMRDGSLIL